MDNNPDLLISRERQKQLEFFTNEAASNYWPRVELTMSGGREYIEPTSGTNSNNPLKTAMNVNQRIFDGFSTQSEVDRRKHLTNAAGHEFEGEKEKIILEVVDYYLDVLRYQQTLVKTDKFIVSINEIVDDIKAMYEAGAIGKAMLDYAVSRQAAATANLSETRSSLNDSRNNLEFLTGPLPVFYAEAPDSLNADNLDREFYVKLASTENTEIKKNLSDLEAMESQLSVEEGKYYPTFDFNLKAEQKHDDGGDVGRGRNLKATFNMTYNLFDGFDRQNKVRRVNSQIKELEYRDEKIFKALKRDISLAYNQITALENTINSTIIEIQSNTALQALNKENFQLGTINAIELIEGEERLNASYARLYELESELYLNTFNLLINSAIVKEDYFCDTCTFSDETSKL